MPHVIVKLWPGKSDEQKAQLTEAIVRDMTNILDAGDASISVAFEEVAPDDWTERVFKPDIVDKWDKLTKEPGYDPRS
jgi:4-oxalocrotonate tautomerase